MYFSWIIKDKLAANSIPRNVEDLDFIKDQKISAVVCLVEDDELEIQDKENNIGIKAYENLLKERGIELLHSPIKNYNAPTIEQVEFILNWINQKLREGKRVMVHCRGGQGRTGTIIASYLMHEYGYTAEEAINFVRSLRPGSIENYSQVRFLRFYENYLKNKHKN
jgi:protein-tyrosine phosphatase